MNEENMEYRLLKLKAGTLDNEIEDLRLERLAARREFLRLEPHTPQSHKAYETFCRAAGKLMDAESERLVVEVHMRIARRMHKAQEARLQNEMGTVEVWTKGVKQ